MVASAVDSNATKATRRAGQFSPPASCSRLLDPQVARELGIVAA
jgi:hypothetical protein